MTSARRDALERIERGEGTMHINVQTIGALVRRGLVVNDGPTCFLRDGGLTEEGMRVLHEPRCRLLRSSRAITCTCREEDSAREVRGLRRRVEAAHATNAPECDRAHER
jgi:hypothetical protein